MHIVVAVKQVLDPDGVNSYALWGRLQVDDSGRSFTIGEAIPRIINAYDEQAMEVALRIRDAATSCQITAVSVGPEPCVDILKRCLALGADRAVLVRETEAPTDGFRVAALLAAVVRRLDSVDLVLCGRQGSDYDQGIVPGVLAEHLEAALVTIAAGVEVDGDHVRVARVTPAGMELVEASLPAVVSLSNEVGLARYPTSRGMLEARRKRPEVFEAADLVGTPGHRTVELMAISVPDVQGHCEIIGGSTAAEKASALYSRLVAIGAIGD